MSATPDDDLGDEPTDLRAEGVALARSPRTLLASVSLFAPTAYAAAVVLRDSPAPLFTRVALGAVALFSVARVSPQLEELPLEARGGGRLALVAGTVSTVLAAGLPLGEGKPFVTAAASAAASLAAAGAVRCAAAITGLGGLGTTPRVQIQSEARRLSFGWAFVGLVFVLGALPLGRFARVLEPLAKLRFGFSFAATVLTLLHLAVSARRRRRELGARERHDLLLGAATLSLPLTVYATTALDPLHAHAHAGVLPLILGPSLAAATLHAQLAVDPVRAAARVGRIWVVLTATAVAASALMLIGDGAHGVDAVAALVIGIALGLVAPRVARAIGIEGEHEPALRAAVASAREAAGTPDPNDVARGVLAALRTLAGMPRNAAERVPSPRLLLFSPLREVLLDAAGEPRTRDPLAGLGEVPVPDPDAPAPLARVLPDGLLRLVAEEPLGVVRVEVLRDLEVRRPDVRPILRWCEARDAEAIVSVVIDGEIDGLLLLPRGPHAEDLGLRKVRVLRSIARLSAMRLSLEAALARAAARAQRAEMRARDVEHVLERTQERERRLSSAVGAAARPLSMRVSAAGYAPATRALLGEIEAVAKTSASVVLVHRPGSDPAAWIARLHVESGRRGALVVVDASRAEGSDPARWSDKSASPIELARGGTLAVLAAGALPREAQKRILAALAFREGPGPDPTPVDLRLVLAAASQDPENDDLAGLRGALDPALVAHLRETPLRLLPLHRRIEDLHALALDRLATLAGSLGREPLGIAPDALAALVDHEWPGDDVELDDVLVRAAQRVSERAAPGARNRIERADVVAVLGRREQA